MDNLINSITSTSDSGITLTLPMAIVAMAAALIFGLVISLTYMGTHKNKYQRGHPDCVPGEGGRLPL